MVGIKLAIDNGRYLFGFVGTTGDCTAGNESGEREQCEDPDFHVRATFVEMTSTLG